MGVNKLILTIKIYYLEKIFFTIILALVSTFSFAQSHAWVNG